MFNPSIFHAYDIRGIYPTDIDAPVMEAFGRAFATVMKPQRVVIGTDVRSSRQQLKPALIEGLRKSGVDVIDAGLMATDMLYFAAADGNYDGGIIITASHNPPEYNGMKFVGKGAEPLAPDKEFQQIKDLAQQNQFKDALRYGHLTTKTDLLDGYLDKCLTFVDKTKLKPLKILINPNFGAVCYTIKELQKRTPFEAVPLNAEADGTFPKGRPDPFRPETRSETIALIHQNKPNFGVAWDGDGDRCFFYDENGDFVDGYIIVCLLAEYFLKLHTGTPIVYESRIRWAIEDTVSQASGKLVREKVGHVFIKQSMRANKAYYGGESSAHHYFGDYYGCDNGLIPFLIIWQMVSEQGSLAELVRPFREKYFTSEETNFTVSDVNTVLKKLEEHYASEELDHFDGLEITHGREWRANIRGSKNEPLLRLNVEAKSQELVDEKLAEISKVIEGASAS